MKYLSKLTVGAAIFLAASPFLEANPLAEEAGSLSRIVSRTLAKSFLEQRTVVRGISALPTRKTLSSQFLVPPSKSLLMISRAPMKVAGYSQNLFQLSFFSSFRKAFERQPHPVSRFSTRANAPAEKTDSNFDWVEYVKTLKNNCVGTIKDFDQSLGRDAERLYDIFEDIAIAKQAGYPQTLDKGALESFITPATRWPYSLKAAKGKIAALSEDEKSIKIKNSIQSITKGIEAFDQEVLDL